MNIDRYRELETTGQLTETEIAEGWHFCPEWDYMLIHPDFPEAEVCTCKNKEENI